MYMYWMVQYFNFVKETCLLLNAHIVNDCLPPVGRGEGEGTKGLSGYPGILTFLFPTSDFDNSTTFYTNTCGKSFNMAQQGRSSSYIVGQYLHFLVINFYQIKVSSQRFTVYSIIYM